MTIGKLARSLLGRWFPIAGRLYRSVFVDLKKVVAAFPPIPPGATLLDIGGGDGEVINELIARYPDTQVTMIDLSPRIGGALRPELRDRVRLFPGTSMRKYAEQNPNPPDLVLISDVIHHVPPEQRKEFFADLRTLVGNSGATILIKDIEPGYPRAYLSWLADRFISGDAIVALVPRAEVKRLLLEAFPAYEVAETRLMETDKPNYALVCTCGTPASLCRSGERI
ncbi:MAG: methyltransferase domain-containing protein [Acidobacteriota bacterium]